MSADGLKWYRDNIFDKLWNEKEWDQHGLCLWIDNVCYI